MKAFPEQQINNPYWHNVVYEYFSNNRDYFNGYLDAVEKAAVPATIQEFVKGLLSQGNELQIIMNPAE